MISRIYKNAVVFLVNTYKRVIWEQGSILESKFVTSNAASNDRYQITCFKQSKSLSTYVRLPFRHNL